jgi:hypothetical protein
VALRSGAALADGLPFPVVLSADARLASGFLFSGGLLVQGFPRCFTATLDQEDREHGD